MRKSKSETAETRCRIVESAATAIRQYGIEGTSVNDLMAAAGLTHGGFYRHFDSKDQLVAEACARGFEAMLASMDEACSACPDKSKAGLAAIADSFLSSARRKECVAACPLTSIGSELARADPATRRVATEGVLRAVNLFARHCPDLSPEAARSHAIAVLSSVVGGITLARIVDDPALADEILRDVRRSIEPA